MCSLVVDGLLSVCFADEDEMGRLQAEVDVLSTQVENAKAQFAESNKKVTECTVFFFLHQQKKAAMEMKQCTDSRKSSQIIYLDL